MTLAADPQPPGAADALARQQTLWAVYRSLLDRFRTLQDGLVARSLVRVDGRWTLTEASALNTAEVVRALFIMETRGLLHDWDARALLQRLATDPGCHSDAQVSALTLWAAATGCDPLADGVFATLKHQMSEGGSQSMTLGWAISALCEYSQMPGRREPSHRLATELLGRLTDNQNPKSGLFHASARREGVLRRRVSDTTLSSQTYPILALATFARVFESAEASRLAQRCADAVTAQQGAQGQWWWRYDARSGMPTNRYPVYCVNQDSAAPAALRALQGAVGHERYESAIGRGLEWQFNPSETAQSLVDLNDRVIVRSVEQQADSFVVNEEMYSYQPARFICASLTQPGLQVPR